jgi:biotin synthase-like enzyme
MKRQLVAEQWDQFARAVLPPQCSDVQRRAMRRAFYAGANSILFRVLQVLAPEGEPTAADLEMMNDIHRELEQYAEMVKAGRA